MQLEYLKSILRDMEVTVVNKIVLSIFSKEKDILHKTCIILYKTYRQNKLNLSLQKKKSKNVDFF